MFHALHAPRSVAAAPRRFAWLLWLALVLPMGQGAAVWHTVVHTVQQADRQDGDDKGLPESACELCLIAAAIASGGPGGEPPSLPETWARHAAPQAAFDGVWQPLAARPYLSRAPPSFLQR